MRHAVIKDGFVVNVIELEPGSKWRPPEGCTVIRADSCEIGDSWDGVVLTNTSLIPEPIIETPRQPTKLDELEARIAALEKR